MPEEVRLAEARRSYLNWQGFHDELSHAEVIEASVKILCLADPTRREG